MVGRFVADHFFMQQKTPNISTRGNQQQRNTTSFTQSFGFLIAQLVYLK